MSRIWARRFCPAMTGPGAGKTSPPPTSSACKEGMQRYGLLLTDAGHHQGRFHVLAAGGRSARFIWWSMPAPRKAISPISASELKGVATLTPRSDRALLALQGPAAAAVLERHAPAFPSSPSCKWRAPRWRARPPSSAAPAIPAKTVLRFRWKAKTPNASPAPCWAKPKSAHRAGRARLVCAWKRGFAFTAMTSTKPSIRWKPIWSGPSASAARPKAVLPAPISCCDKLLNGVASKRVGILPEGRAPAREGTEIAVNGKVDRQGHLRRLRPQPERPAGDGLCRNANSPKPARSWN